MSPDEVTAIYKAMDNKERTSWEQTRTICYYNFTSMNGNEMKLRDGTIKIISGPKDLFKLPWDEK
jgi:hypothetical protein